MPGDLPGTTIASVGNDMELDRKMDQNLVQRLVIESAVEVNGRKTISCARAFELHHRNGIALSEIGRICNENGIRICACQLGCFK